MGFASYGNSIESTISVNNATICSTNSNVSATGDLPCSYCSFDCPRAPSVDERRRPRPIWPRSQLKSYLEPLRESYSGSLESHADKRGFAKHILPSAAHGQLACIEEHLYDDNAFRAVPFRHAEYRVVGCARLPGSSTGPCCCAANRKRRRPLAR